MKAKSIVIAIGMMLAASAWADGPNAGTDAPANTSAPVATELPAADVTPDQFQKMDENLDRMHDLVGQMMDAKGPAERQKLMIEYMTAQHENMMLARDAMGMGPGMGMGGPGMGMMGKKGCDMDGMRGMGGMGMMGKKGCDMDGMRGMGSQGDEAMMAHIRSMEKRLDALQEMMKMMMEQ